MCICGAVDTPQWLMSKLFKEVSFEINGQSQCIKNQKRSLNPSLCLVDTHTSSCCTARGDNMTHVWELLSAVVCAAACSPLLTLRCSDSGVNPVSRTLVFAGSHNWHKERCFMLSWLFKQMWLLGLLVLLCFARVDRETVGEQQQRRSAQSGKSLFLNWIKFDGGLQEIYVTDIVGIVWQTTISAGFNTYIPQRLMKSCCVSFVLSL